METTSAATSQVQITTPCGMQEGIFGGAAGQRHRTYRFTNGGRRPVSWASTAEREGGPVVHQDLLVSLACAAKKSISFAEHNTLVTANGPA
jgi:hypothetical protein